jgi:hypothetical protein
MTAASHSSSSKIVEVEIARLLAENKDEENAD